MGVRKNRTPPLAVSKRLTSRPSSVEASAFAWSVFDGYFCGFPQGNPASKGDVVGFSGFTITESNFKQDDRCSTPPAAHTPPAGFSQSHQHPEAV